MAQVTNRMGTKRTPGQRRQANYFACSAARPGCPNPIAGTTVHWADHQLAGGYCRASHSANPTLLD